MGDICHQSTISSVTLSTMFSWASHQGVLAIKLDHDLMEFLLKYAYKEQSLYFASSIFLLPLATCFPLMFRPSPCKSRLAVPASLFL